MKMDLTNFIIKNVRGQGHRRVVELFRFSGGWVGRVF